MAHIKRTPTYIINDLYDYGFLPRQGQEDFVIICTDQLEGSDDEEEEEEGESEANEGGETDDSDVGGEMASGGFSSQKGCYKAFGVKAHDLRKISPFFKERISAAKHKHEMWINADEECDVIGALLSAAFEPTHALLADQGKWPLMLRALRLAQRWQMELARAALFQAMLDWLPKLGDDPEEGHDLCDLFCEAAVQGDTALSHLVTFLRIRKQANLPSFRISSILFSSQYSLELGTARLSKVAQTLFDLARDGVLQ